LGAHSHHFLFVLAVQLPGYILPSIPPITILTGDYLFRRRQLGLNRWVLVGHAMLSGVMTISVLLLPGL